MPGGSLAPHLLQHPPPREMEPAGRTPRRRGCIPHRGCECTSLSRAYPAWGRSPPAPGHQEAHGDRQGQALPVPPSQALLQGQLLLRHGEHPPISRLPRACLYLWRKHFAAPLPVGWCLFGAAMTLGQHGAHRPRHIARETAAPTQAARAGSPCRHLDRASPCCRYPKAATRKRLSHPTQC